MPMAFHLLQPPLCQQQIAARSVTVRHGAPLPYWQEDSAAQRTTRQHRPALLRCLKPVVVLESS